MSLDPNFFIVPGTVVKKILAKEHAKVMDVVRQTYLNHERGKTINPDSYFLRFDDRPDARIIALPAAIKGDEAISGIKWIASYPENTRHNLQRASATLVLNDYQTGYPMALLEASQISAARTAASCVLAAQWLSQEKRMKRVAVIGAGVIARAIMEYFFHQDWVIDELVLYAASFDDCSRLKALSEPFCKKVTVVSDAPSAIRSSSHVVLATTAVVPYLHQTDLLTPGQVVLNISLRDLAPQLLLNAFNLFDDVEHCLKASTSPHLAEQMTGGRDFVAGTLAQLMLGEIVVNRSCPLIFSPFGLGVLDVAVGQYLLDVAIAKNLAKKIEGFFPDVARW